MKQKIINFFKSFNLFDWIYLPLSLVAVMVVSIVFKSDAYSTIYSMISLLSVFLLSKGLLIAPFCLIVSYVMYAIQSYYNALYGEAILNMFILLPIQVITIILWFRKHRAKNKQSTQSVIVNDIKIKEWLCIIVATLALGVAAYFGLQALNTNYLILSTFTFVLPIVANYLILRGSLYQFVVYTIVNFFLIAIWLLPIFQGLPQGANFVPMAVSFVSFTISDIYGLINWIKLRKQQKLTQDNQILEENIIQKEK